MSVQNLESKNQSLKSKVQNQCLKPKSEVCQLSKSETEVESLKSKVRSKFFAIIITLSYNTSIIYSVSVDQL